MVCAVQGMSSWVYDIIAHKTLMYDIHRIPVVDTGGIMEVERGVEALRVKVRHTWLKGRNNLINLTKTLP